MKAGRATSTGSSRIGEELAKVLGRQPGDGHRASRDQADQLAIPPNERRQFTKTLAQGNLELAKGLADAVARAVAKGEARRLKPRRLPRQKSKWPLKSCFEKARGREDEKIRTAKGQEAHYRYSEIRPPTKRSRPRKANPGTSQAKRSIPRRTTSGKPIRRSSRHCRTSTTHCRPLTRCFGKN